MCHCQPVFGNSTGSVRTRDSEEKVSFAAPFVYTSVHLCEGTFEERQTSCKLGKEVTNVSTYWKGTVCIKIRMESCVSAITSSSDVDIMEDPLTKQNTNDELSTISETALKMDDDEEAFRYTAQGASYANLIHTPLSLFFFSGRP